MKDIEPRQGATAAGQHFGWAITQPEPVKELDSLDEAVILSLEGFEAALGNAVAAKRYDILKRSIAAIAALTAVYLDRATDQYRMDHPGEPVE